MKDFKELREDKKVITEGTDTDKYMWKDINAAMSSIGLNPNHIARVLSNLKGKAVREAYGPAAPKMKRSRSAGSGGDKYIVRYQGGKNTVYANSPDDALKKSMKFFDVGPVGKDRYMRNATAIAESVTERKGIFKR